MDIIDIESALQVFSRKDLQTVITIKIVMDREGISFKDLEDYLKELTRRVKQEDRKRQKEYQERLKEHEDQRKRWLDKTDKCPECGEPLMLNRVTTPKGPANVNGYRSIWYCLGKNCTYEKYTKEIVEDLYDQVMKRED